MRTSRRTEPSIKQCLSAEAEASLSRFHDGSWVGPAAGRAVRPLTAPSRASPCRAFVIARSSARGRRAHFRQCSYPRRLFYRRCSVDGGAMATTSQRSEYSSCCPPTPAISDVVRAGPTDWLSSRAIATYENQWSAHDYDVEFFASGRRQCFRHMTRKLAHTGQHLTLGWTPVNRQMVRRHHACRHSAAAMRSKWSLQVEVEGLRRQCWRQQRIWHHSAPAARELRRRQMPTYVGDRVSGAEIRRRRIGAGKVETTHPKRRAMMVDDFTGFISL